MSKVNDNLGLQINMEKMIYFILRKLPKCYSCFVHMMLFDKKWCTNKNILIHVENFPFY